MRIPQLNCNHLQAIRMAAFELEEKIDANIVYLQGSYIGKSVLAYPAYENKRNRE